MKTRGLVFCGDIWHSAEIVRRGLSGLDGVFTFEFVNEGVGLMADRLADLPLVVLAKANIISDGKDCPWITRETARELVEHVRRGNGLLTVHGGTSRYESVPEVNGLLGGAFVSHPEQCDVMVEPIPGHLMTNGIAPFTVRDEHYFMSPLAADADVFLHSRSSHGVQPAGWTRTEGAGRVCALTPGHNLEVWMHAEFQKLLLNALRWTAKLN